jgi:hypothetical protein
LYNFILHLIFSNQTHCFFKGTAQTFEIMLIITTIFTVVNSSWKKQATATLAVLTLGLWEMIKKYDCFNFMSCHPRCQGKYSHSCHYWPFLQKHYTIFTVVKCCLKKASNSNIGSTYLPCVFGNCDSKYYGFYLLS